MAVILTVGMVDIIRYIILGAAVPLITVCVVEIIFAALSYTAWKTGFPLVFTGCGCGGSIIFYNDSF